MAAEAADWVIPSAAAAWVAMGGFAADVPWQELDIAPRYPVLTKFLHFWATSLDGKLHSVRVGSATLISPPKWHHQQVLTLQ